MQQTIRQNSARAWWLAARPKTLTAALVPVAVALALVYRHTGGVAWRPAVLCVLFAALMQVASNFINDLFDFLKGTDREDRLGPERACAQGWLTPRAMRGGIAIALALAGAAGLGLLPYGGTGLLWVGAACVLFAFLYTTLLSRCGLGDVLVYVFFGWVPVVATFYVQTGTTTAAAWWAGAACGFVIDTLLVLNNYRDRDTDRAVEKRTLIAWLGEPFGRYFYLAQGLMGYACWLVASSGGNGWQSALPLIYIGLHLGTWRTMARIRQGRALNRVLALTSRNLLVFGATAVVGVGLGG